MLTLLLASALFQAAPAPVPAIAAVYVYTAASPLDPETKDRQASVDDLRSSLADRKKHLRVVDDQAAADVKVEVVDRTYTVPRMVIGLPQAGRPGQLPSPDLQRAVHLRVRLTRGDTVVQFDNKNKPLESNNGWKSAADDIAKQIDNWLASHPSNDPRGQTGDRPGSDPSLTPV